MTTGDRDERDELVMAFAGFPSRLAAAAAAANRPVPTGDWGPAENVRHLIAVERAVWHIRLAEVVTQDTPAWSWTEPGQALGFDGSPLAEILDAFAAVRAETVATLAALDEAGWGRTGTHATYGVLDVAGLIRLANHHDAEHLAGMAKTV